MMEYIKNMGWKTIANLVQTTMKVAAFNANGHKYSYYINGKLMIQILM